MIERSELLLIGAVAAVGVLHTIVPDHWIPITLIARQQGWRKGEVARAALVAGTGHTVSTLLIGLAVWIAGVAFATKFGNLVSVVSSIALTIEPHFSSLYLKLGLPSRASLATYVATARSAVPAICNGASLQCACRRILFEPIRMC